MPRADLRLVAVPDGEATNRTEGAGLRRGGGGHMRRLIPIQQAAEYTGLSRHTLYAMVSQRRVPYVKVGRLVKFDVELLDKWIDKSTVMPMPPRGS